ncbi:PREDICTED: LOW QUALITY PROTEIN: butyrophilin subfamily 2 member A1-like [Cercocebus atys]|uniref:LOW QUALITY PROTEIN: butyrophilin subfamily 2 member A1-like n=1 Tax=Cercocebus atys TaxID=9531 RepID=UPI0005F4FD1C|nr:PREDICTED: LOW QUALITY PROTEIN: butyrophilin subfamily 2 member A1-like [Cercocebus atys]
MEPAAALHFSLPASLLLLLLLFLLRLCALVSAQFIVVGPTDSILATVGEDTTLRCHLSPEKNAEDMEVRWFRSQFFPAVFVYKGGRERTEEQMEEYRGRTTFVSKDISRGSVALVIHNITAQENGTYRCYFQEGRSYDEAILHLVVAGALLHFALLLWHSVTLGKVCLLTSCPLQTSKFLSGIPFTGRYHRDTLPVETEFQGKILPTAQGLHEWVPAKPRASLLEKHTQNYFLREKATELAEEPFSCAPKGTLTPDVLFQTKWTFLAAFSESFMPSVSPCVVALPIIVVFLMIIIAVCIYWINRLQKEKKILSGEKEFELETREIAVKELEKERVQREKELQVQEQLQEELRGRKTVLHAVDVVLDPDTAHPDLLLSEDRRSVRRCPLRHLGESVPDNPERFDSEPCVLGRESFASGKHYWEVEVENVMEWTVGVCRDSVERKGEVLLLPQNGFWTLDMHKRQYRALSSPKRILPLKESLCRVGVFLDYEAGDVSFYNMRDRSHIYTCPRSAFSVPVRPFFRIGSDDSPIFICPALIGASGVTVPEEGLILHRVGTNQSL